ncbi:DMT family transporter [Thermophagus xiamenensis]|uniref:EamA domain-containing membrane protein RarD n=1 Tax=Thermophagus xiamenensis TaxID=385682 RepID=A0A1I2D5Z7_9BACT|nr:DMT family transporter [Thermophagus xiamenensis]SFE75956.1 EamA domain-containing membrane protein RarD [Thermophagus xiamenensis]
MSQSSKGLFYATITALLWGVLAIVLKVSLNYFDSYTIVWWRFTMAFTFLIAYFGIKSRRQLLILKKPPLLLLLAGLLLGVNYIGFMQGVHYAGPAVTQVMIQIGPIMLALTGFLIFKEQLTRLRAIGFFLALIGFIFFYYQQLQTIVSDVDLLNEGVIWVLTGALAWTAYAILNKILVRHISSGQINLILYGVPALLFLPFANFSSLLEIESIWEVVLLLFLGGNTLVAYGSLSLALKYADANKVSMVITINPVITFILMEVLLWNQVTWFTAPPVQAMSYVGAAMVLVGAMLAIGAIDRKKKK